MVDRHLKLVLAIMIIGFVGFLLQAPNWLVWLGYGFYILYHVVMEWLDGEL